MMLTKALAAHPLVRNNDTPPACAVMRDKNPEIFYLVDARTQAKIARFMTAYIEEAVWHERDDWSVCP